MNLWIYITQSWCLSARSSRQFTLRKPTSWQDIKQMWKALEGEGIWKSCSFRFCMFSHKGCRSVDLSRHSLTDSVTMDKIFLNVMFKMQVKYCSNFHRHNSVSSYEVTNFLISPHNAEIGWVLPPVCLVLISNFSFCILHCGMTFKAVFLILWRKNVQIVVSWRNRYMKLLEQRDRFHEKIFFSNIERVFFAILFWKVLLQFFSAVLMTSLSFIGNYVLLCSKVVHCKLWHFRPLLSLEEEDLSWFWFNLGYPFAFISGLPSVSLSLPFLLWSIYLYV